MNIFCRSILTALPNVFPCVTPGPTDPPTGPGVGISTGCIFPNAFPNVFPNVFPCVESPSPSPKCAPKLKYKRNSLFLYIGNSYTEGSLGPINWEIDVCEIDLSNFGVVTFTVSSSRTCDEELIATGFIQIEDGVQYVNVPLTAEQVSVIAGAGYGLAHEFICVATSSEHSDRSFRAASGILEIR